MTSFPGGCSSGSLNVSAGGTRRGPEFLGSCGTIELFRVLKVSLSKEGQAEFSRESCESRILGRLRARDRS